MTMVYITYSQMGVSVYAIHIYFMHIHEYIEKQMVEILATDESR